MPENKNINFGILTEKIPDNYETICGQKLK